MRWFWIDRFVEFVSGQYAVATKNVSLVEEQIDDYSPGLPMMPASLIVEGLAQTGGILAAQVSDFKERVVLAKISRAVFHEPAYPGDTLTYTAKLQNVQGGGAMITGTSHKREVLQAEIDLFFAHLDDRFDGVELFEPAGFLRMLRVLKLFEIAKNHDGSPIAIPPYMLEAEIADNEKKMNLLSA
jgi:3-hydroxyacyl-[acyl-carrier-protein] dehydratase